MNHWRVRLAVFGITIAASFAAFEILLLLQDPGWKSSEHVAIIFWSIPLGFIVLGVGSLLRRRLGTRSGGVRGFVVAIAAVAVTIIWTFGAIVLTGGYALAFDANPLWCWFIGSLAGLVVALFWSLEHKSSSAAAVT